MWGEKVWIVKKLQLPLNQGIMVILTQTARFCPMYDNNQ